MNKGALVRLAGVRKVRKAKSDAIDEVRGSEFFEPEYYLTQYSRSHSLRNRDSDWMDRIRDLDDLDYVDWRKMARNTGPITPMEEAKREVSKACYCCLSIQDVIRKALNGNPVAQYRMAEICVKRAPQYEEDRSKALLKALAMFLLVSGREGNYSRSRRTIFLYLHRYPKVDLRNKRSVEKYVNNIIKAHTNRVQNKREVH